MILGKYLLKEEDVSKEGLLIESAAFWVKDFKV